MLMPWRQILPVLFDILEDSLGFVDKPQLPFNLLFHFAQEDKKAFTSRRQVSALAMRPKLQYWECVSGAWWYRLLPMVIIWDRKTLSSSLTALTKWMDGPRII